MKRGPQSIKRKRLSAEGLLKCVRKAIKKINGKGKELTTSDCIMSAVAMFGLKSPSLLAFDHSRKDPMINHNLRTLYGIKHAPCDTYMREILDEVCQKDLRDIFLSIFKSIQSGKLLDRYKFLDGYLLSIDGTEIFNSDKVRCNNCCEKQHRNGKKAYYHQIFAGSIVNPDMKQVIPLCPEPIYKHDGSSKNDCERNAAKRFLNDLQREHPRLKVTLVADALHADAQSINCFKKLGKSFIVGVKKGNHKSLFEWIDGLKLEEENFVVNKNHYYFRFINNIPLNDTENAPEVNFLECRAVEIYSKKTIERYFTWVTDHKINKDNVYLIMKGGRAKWKIENETFNTLKTQGYQFEHNFGHGKKNLNSVFATLMMTAFLIDQVQEAACGLFNSALSNMKTRRALWERIKGFFALYFIKTWDDLFNSIHKEFNGATLRVDSS